MRRNDPQYGLPLPPNRSAGRGLGVRPNFTAQIAAKQRMAAVPRFAPNPQIAPTQRPKPPARAQQPVRKFVSPYARDPATGEYLAPNKYQTGTLGKGGKAYETDPKRIIDFIADAARKRLVVMLHYQKVTGDRKLVTRAVEPYSIRYRTPASRGFARTRYLYANCVNGPTLGIHSFLTANIQSATVTTQRFTPQWVVEFDAI